jgi:hypothetical protein
VAAIGVGAFAVSFLALGDLIRTIGYSSTTAWVFPAINDAAVSVSTLMLVALGDKPARRSRPVNPTAAAQPAGAQGRGGVARHSAEHQVRRGVQAQTVQIAQPHKPVSVQPEPVQRDDVLAQAATQADAEIAMDLIASGATTQPVETVIAVLAARRDGASINAAARASGINYRTAQRIVVGAAEHRQLPAVS